MDGSTPSLPLRLLLAFTPAAFERRFVAHYVATYLRYAQVSLVLGMVLVFGDFAVDWFAHPGLPANLLRVQVGIPLLGLGLVYAFLPVARRHWQPVMAAFITTVAVCLFYILLRIDAEGGAGIRSWVGILNFTFLEFYCFVILGVQFRYALVSGLVILASFEFAVWGGSGFTPHEAAYWSYHVVTVFTLVVGIGWWREYLLRQEFAARVSLDEARAAAERLARTKSEFLAIMSHEIRTPMNGVLGMTELLIDSTLDDTQRRRAETIRDSGQALLTVLNDILDFSKIEAGRVELRHADVDLRELAADAVRLFTLEAQRKGVEIEGRVAPEVPDRVRADPMRLRQILLNLLGNAVKFTDAGQVRLSIEPDGAGASALRFSVCDSGIGIAAEAQARLFQPFSQADASTTRRYGGTGLGLAICRQLVELMGGRIGVDSSSGRGACFWFTLDVAVGAVEEAPPAAPIEIDEFGQFPGLRVLLAEDNLVNQEIAHSMLESMACTVITASHGRDALACWHADRFDLVLMDCQMPELDGFDVTRAIRAAEAGSGRRVPIVAVTANVMSEDRERCAAAGMDDYLAKPFSRRELSVVVARGLRRAQAAVATAGSATESPRPPATSDRGQVVEIDLA